MHLQYPFLVDSKGGLRMEPIGGYFELELSKGGHYHKDAIKLNTARNCFEYVLRVRHYSKVYIPYYTCEVILEPLKKLGINYEFYHINELMEPVSFPELSGVEAFLYTNYFGLKQGCVKLLAKRFGNHLIVDNAQSFYAEPIQGIDTFYSARKYFGVPDGAYLYSEIQLEEDWEQDVSYERMLHLLKRIDLEPELGYQDFCFNEGRLCYQGIKTMSKLTERVLNGVDYDSTRQIRCRNFLFLDNVLKDSNLVHWDLEDDTVPMVYPYLTDDMSLRKKLIENRVFVATYWPNVMKWCDVNDLESYLAQHLVFLPVDQRYTLKDMKTIIGILNSDK